MSEEVRYSAAQAAMRLVIEREKKPIDWAAILHELSKRK